MNFKEKTELDNEKYISAFRKYGRSPKSLLWWTDKRNIRYHELLKHLNLTSGATLLDVGCGFADLYKFCNDYLGIRLNYTGIDYCGEFIETVKNQLSDECALIQGDFLLAENLTNYDYCVATGIFNMCNGSSDDVENGFLRSVVKKMFSICDVAISFNFVTDKVDYKNPEVSYYSPMKILDFCYGLSRNIVFDNSCMPFEATVTVFKDCSFDNSRVFNSFKKNYASEFQKGIFITSVN